MRVPRASAPPTCVSPNPRIKCLLTHYKRAGEGLVPAGWSWLCGWGDQPCRLPPAHFRFHASPAASTPRLTRLAAFASGCQAREQQPGAGGWRGADAAAAVPPLRRRADHARREAQGSQLRLQTRPTTATPTSSSILVASLARWRSVADRGGPVVPHPNSGGLCGMRACRALQVSRRGWRDAWVLPVGRVRLANRTRLCAGRLCTGRCRPRGSTKNRLEPAVRLDPRGSAMRVIEIWRYPVKSLAGERLDAVRVDARGLEGDRLWALVDPDGAIASGKPTRRFRKVPGLLHHRGHLEHGQPVITLADGRSARADDPALADLVAAITPPWLVAAEREQYAALRRGRGARRSGFERGLRVADHHAAFAAIDDPQLDGANAQRASDPTVFGKWAGILDIQQQVGPQPLDGHRLADGLARRSEGSGRDYAAAEDARQAQRRMRWRVRPGDHPKRAQRERHSPARLTSARASTAGHRASTDQPSRAQRDHTVASLCRRRACRPRRADGR
jgi:MOSC N-terminal beta barrel domain